MFNPKVVSSAKGSLFRVECQYVDLQVLVTKNPNLPVYGTFMDGESIYSAKLPDMALVVIGNEANGIGEQLQGSILHRISIPNFGKAESLNAAVAAGLVLGEFRRPRLQ